MYYDYQLKDVRAQKEGRKDKHKDKRGIQKPMLISIHFLYEPHH
jgi:hypothetical protein